MVPTSHSCQNVSDASSDTVAPTVADHPNGASCEALCGPRGPP